MDESACFSLPKRLCTSCARISFRAIASNCNTHREGAKDAKFSQESQKRAKHIGVLRHSLRFLCSFAALRWILKFGAIAVGFLLLLQHFRQWRDNRGNSHRLSAFQAIDPGQQFRNGNIELRRNALVKVDLHEQRDEFRRFVHINAVFASARNDASQRSGHALWQPPAVLRRSGCRREQQRSSADHCPVWPSVLLSLSASTPIEASVRPASSS